MRRVAALVVLASLGVVAFAVVGGAAGVIYAVAAAVALLGLLLPPALKRQRAVATGESEPRPAPAGTRGRAPTWMRRLGPVRELEERLAEQERQNVALREQLRMRLAELERARSLLEQTHSEHEETLRRVEEKLSRHSRERALLAAQLEAMEPLVAPRPALRPTGFRDTSAPQRPLEGGSRSTAVQPTTS